MPRRSGATASSAGLPFTGLPASVAEESGPFGLAGLAVQQDTATAVAHAGGDPPLDRVAPCPEGLLCFGCHVGQLPLRRPHAIPGVIQDLDGLQGAPAVRALLVGGVHAMTSTAGANH